MKGQTSDRKKAKVKYPVKYYKRSKHHHIIIRENKDTNVSVGITHSPKRGNHKNIPLEVNPNPSDSTQAYILDYPVKDRTELYEKSKRKLNIHESDYAKVEKVGKKKPQDMSKKNKRGAVADAIRRIEAISTKFIALT